MKSTRWRLVSAWKRILDVGGEEGDLVHRRLPVAETRLLLWQLRIYYRVDAWRRCSMNLLGTQRSDMGRYPLGSSSGLFGFGSAMFLARRQIFLGDLGCKEEEGEEDLEPFRWLSRPGLGWTQSGSCRLPWSQLTRRFPSTSLCACCRAWQRDLWLLMLFPHLMLLLCGHSADLQTGPPSTVCVWLCIPSECAFF